VRERRNTNGELLRDRLDALLSVIESSWADGDLSFLAEDLPRSLSELASLEGKRERASIMDLTDILFLRGGAGVAGSGGVGVLGGEGGTCGGGVSVHVDDLRAREKKGLASELPLLPGLGPWIAHERLLDGGCGSAQGTMEEEADEPSPALLGYLSAASPIPGAISK
jgi:hypothetical protein